MLTPRRRILFVFLVSFAGLLVALTKNDTGGQKQPQTATPVELQISNVNLHLEREIVLEVRRLRGQMQPTNNAGAITLDDMNSFRVRIDSAEIAISLQTIALLLNNYVFAYPGAPLKHIQLTAKNGTIKQTGTMHKGVDLPFEIEGPLDVTPEGEIRLHAHKIHSAHLPFKSLLHLFGEDLSKLINLKQDRGVRLEGDNILINPGRILPPPRIEGKLITVRVEADRIVQTFETKEVKPLAPPLKARSYLYHRGGIVRFGKLTMHDADLEIVSLSHTPIFDFSLPEYNRQLVAGYSKNTQSQGVIAFMPDLSSLSVSSKDTPAPSVSGAINGQSKDAGRDKKTTQTSNRQ